MNAEQMNSRQLEQAGWELIGPSRAAYTDGKIGAWVVCIKPDTYRITVFDEDYDFYRNETRCYSGLDAVRLAHQKILDRQT